MTWFEQATLDEGTGCSHNTRCQYATPDGNCDPCNTIDGRFMEAVNEYASTCDGPCAELTHHNYLTMDPETQLGYCSACMPLLPAEVRARLEKDNDA